MEVKKHKIATVFAGALLALGTANLSIAEENTSASSAEKTDISFSANLGMVSDYRFRGISQKDRNPAIQGGIDLDFGNGFYVGTWASQVDFAYGKDETDYEQDFYGGYTAEINDSISYDVGYIYYAYHGSNQDEDYWELYGSLSISDLTLGFAYAKDYWAQSGQFYYPYADYSFSLPAAISLDLHVGFNYFEEYNEFLHEDDAYVDYSATLHRDFGGLNLSAAFVGTDVSKEECFDTDWCEPTLLVGATYTW
ncbi:TorF family putative porin [Microbulbifer echini]|uniref:TorF family putative porin n=1 Tax=Microbulbifer echini TaxID=1529067 RepID=A0ABV4NIZ7_9GAMM|nr:TorF family putative porin [uncultured Microbulbifer sp.]